MMLVVVGELRFPRVVVLGEPLSKAQVKTGRCRSSGHLAARRVSRSSGVPGSIPEQSKKKLFFVFLTFELLIGNSNCLSVILRFKT